MAAELCLAWTGEAPVPTRACKLHAVRSLADQRQEFSSRFFFVAEAAEHGRRYRGRMLFLDAAHHHAQMAGLDDYADALRFDGVLDRLRNLRGQPLLDLQAARERFDEARYFAQADNFSVWDISHVHLAKKRQKMVLAQAEHFDVFHDHHLVVVDREQRLTQERFGIVLLALDAQLHGLMHARGCTRKAFAIRIFAEADNHFAHQVLIGGAGEGVWLSG